MSNENSDEPTLHPDQLTVDEVLGMMSEHPPRKMSRMELVEPSRIRQAILMGTIVSAEGGNDYMDLLIQAPGAPDILLHVSYTENPWVVAWVENEHGA